MQWQKMQSFCQALYNFQSHLTIQGMDCRNFDLSESVDFLFRDHSFRKKKYRIVRQ